MANAAESKTLKWILIAAIVLIVFLIDKNMYRQPRPWLWGNASDVESAWLIGYLAFLASIYGPAAGAVAGFLSEVIYAFFADQTFLYFKEALIMYMTACTVYGLLTGQFAKMLKLGKAGSLVKDLLKFNIAQLAGSVISMGLF